MIEDFESEFWLQDVCKCSLGRGKGVDVGGRSVGEGTSVDFGCAFIEIEPRFR